MCRLRLLLMPKMLVYVEQYWQHRSHWGKSKPTIRPATSRSKPHCNRIDSTMPIMITSINYSGMPTPPSNRFSAKWTERFVLNICETGSKHPSRIPHLADDILFKVIEVQ